MKLIFLCMASCLLLGAIANAGGTHQPVDAREIILPGEFQKTSPLVWQTDWKNPKFAFDEAIYSWNARLEKGEGFRVYARFGFQNKETTPWLYAGFWGEAKPRKQDIQTTCSLAKIKYDHIFTEIKASSFQFKIESEGTAPLETIPSFHFVYTDNSPDGKSLAFKTPVPKIPPVILDLPLRSQKDSSGKYMKSTCQSAALGSVLEYFGENLLHEDIVSLVYDPEYKLYGIWPRIVATTSQLGFSCYIDRFREWNSVKAAIAENKVILCSIRMPKGGNYIDPPYPKMGGHIVALNGITDDGRVIVTDSALSRNNRGFRCQWLDDDFEQVWIKNKGGIAMVVCPGETSIKKEVSNLPPFCSYKKQKR